MWRRDVGVGGGDGRVRVLVESADPTLRIAEFRRYRDAGLDVTLCGGPVGDERCPLVDGGECPSADSADVVLFGLDAGGDVLAAHRAQHPSLPVVAEVRRDRPVPDGCTALPFPSSIDEQIRVLRRTARRRSPSRP
jgi:hypothetical protein